MKKSSLKCWSRLLQAAGLCAFLFQATAAGAATCTSKASGSWASAATWTCTGTPVVTAPTATDTAIIASPNTVSLVGSVPVTNLTVNTGGTLADAGFTLTISGNLTNNGTISGGGNMGVTGAASTISGMGSFANSRLYVSGTAVTVAAGSTLSFSGSSRLYAGRTSAGATVAGSVLTINGTIASTVPVATTTFLRLYANSTVIGSTGAVSGSTSAAAYYATTAAVTNNGSVSLQQITQNAATNVWTQGANSSLTLSAVSTVGMLNASATGNTVTYTAPATPIVPSGSTYYNLAGGGVVCPHGFTILGSDPCAVAGGGYVISSPSSCTNLTGVGTVAWATPGDALTSNNVYAKANPISRSAITNYLNCTGFNFAAIPLGATISGITVYVERKTSGGALRDAYVYLIKGGAIQTVYNGAKTTNYTTADVVELHGGATNKWGGTWTDADFKAANFGVAFAVKEAANSFTSRTVSVDQIYARVDYTAMGTDHVSIATSNIGSTCAPNNVNIVAHTATHTASLLAGTIRLTTSDSKGDWAVVAGAGTLNNGTANDGLATYAFASGESSVVLAYTHTTAGTVTINVADNTSGSSLLTNTPANEIANSITYSSGGFTIADSAGATISNLTQIAGQTSPTYYLKATSSGCGNAFSNVVRSIDMAFECIDPASCQSPVVSITNATTNVTTALPAGLPAGSNPATVTTYTPVSLNFNANSLAPFKLTYPDAGNITLYFRYTPSSLLSESSPFVVRPAGFVLSGIKRTSDNFANPAAADATGAKFVRAGEAFSATVTALTASGASKANAGTAINCATVSSDCTPNFGHEVAPESVKLTPALVAGLGLVSNPAITCADRANATTCDNTVNPVVPKFGSFAGASATGSNLAWDEVGIITLTPSIADGDYLGTGDVTGTTSAHVGRFALARFALQNVLLDNRADLCNGGVLASDGVTPCPALNYMGEEVDASFTLVPQSLTGSQVNNYLSSSTAAQNFARLDPSSVVALNLAAVDSVSPGGPHYLGARLDMAGLPPVFCGTTPCFQTGFADVTVPFALSRSAAADGPYTAVEIGFAPMDSDGAVVLGAGGSGALCNNPNAVDCYDMDADAVVGNDHALLGAAEFRYGRMKLSNAHGSELLPLPMAATVQYYDGANWVTSATDNLTQFNTNLSPTGNVVVSVVSGLAGGVSVASSGVVSVVGGVRAFTLNKPGVAGSVDISLNAPTYLPSNKARATFGVYKGGNEFIYLRENY